MNVKKILQVFLGSWAVLIFLVVFTDAGSLSPWEQVLSTGVLAALVALLAIVATRGERKNKRYSVCDPATGEVICRVEGDWIFKGSEEKASWYIKRGAVYGFANMKPLYRMKDGGLYREGEDQPVLKLEKDRLADCADGHTVYEIR